MRSTHGFTLIELITVIVLLSIVAAIGSGFVVTAVDSYRDTQERAKLVQKGRLAIEQMTRQLRAAVPHSVRTDDAGSCVEFLPIVGGANYINPISYDAVNDQLQEIANITISPLVLSGIMGSPKYVVIAPSCTTEIYAGDSCSEPLTAGSSLVEINDGDSVGEGDVEIDFTLHAFPRNSISRRLFVAGEPVRFCVNGNDLVSYRNYGLLADANSAPDVMPELIVVDVIPAGTQAFAISDESEDRGAAIDINLSFMQGNTSIQLKHQVLVRNVP